MMQPSPLWLSLVFTVTSAFLGAGCAVSAEEATSTEAISASEQGWDSQKGNPTHATHSYLTEYAIDQLGSRYPELRTYRASLVDGANLEIHELRIADAEQERLRLEVDGTNWACNRPDVLWKYAQAAYARGDKSKAYWYTGILLHYVEDMGVPAHAFHTIHQGNASEFDTFELLALQKWSPSFSPINRGNPGFANPAGYVNYSGDWAATDFRQTWPGTTYRSRFFSVSWLWASSREKTFMRQRQGRTATATAWALEAAASHLR